MLIECSTTGATYFCGNDMRQQYKLWTMSCQDRVLHSQDFQEVYNFRYVIPLIIEYYNVSVFIFFYVSE